MAHVIGIDLGTTNSCVAVVENGTPQVITNKAGYKTTPSIVALTDGGKRLVGQMAKRQAITNAKNTIFAAKRLIGRAWDSPQVEHCLKTCPYRIVQGPHQDARIELRGKVYSLPEIASMILTEMRSVAEDFLGEEVTQAVITVPAYFNDGQRQSTKDAGKIAGLDVLRIINEPTAAALAYGYNRDIDSKIAVYDLGGGTFDISILEIVDGVFDVISTAGDTFLGGEDFDSRIIEWLAFQFAEQHMVDLREDEMALQRFKDAAEKAKIELSTRDTVEINLPFIWTSDLGEPLHLQAQLTREVFEGLVVDLAERTLRICEVTLSEARMSSQEIEEVVLVGGMTRMPMVQRMVQGFFRRAPSKSVHPDEAVAIGAAIQGLALSEGSADVLLLDVTPLALGVAVYGGGFDRIIEKNTTIPVRQSRIFTTSRRNQTSIKVIVLQGNENQASENELLGEFTLSGLRSAPAGEVDVEITFDIDSDGIVRVSAVDIHTGRSQSISVTASSQLSEDEIQAMMDEHQEFLMEARRDDDLEEIRVQLRKKIRDIERLFPQVDLLIGDSPSGVQTLDQAEQTLSSAHDALESKHTQDLDQTLLHLDEILKNFKTIAQKS